jgi:hypothetical protein
MPTSLVITVLVVQVLGSTVGLAGKPTCVEAGQGNEAVDPEEKQEHYDDVHPPHADHHLSVAIFACPAGSGRNLATLMARLADAYLLAAWALAAALSDCL